MRVLIVTITMLALLLIAPMASGINPDDELWITAAGRGDGGAGSFWVTDLYLTNLTEDDLELELTWLERMVDGSDAEPMMIDIAGGETVVLEDVVLDFFGLESSFGAIQIEVAEDEDNGENDDAAEMDDDARIVAQARIYNVSEAGTFGQGLEGMTSVASIDAELEESTLVAGASNNATFRSNWFGVNITEEDNDEGEEEAAPAEVMVELLNDGGDVFASANYLIPPRAAIFHSISDLTSSQFDHATVRFTMVEGEGLFSLSKIDGRTNDPTTLQSHWDCQDSDDLAFTEEFAIDRCTFSTTGGNAFFSLDPGHRLVLEGEEDDEMIRVEIDVLNETFMVDGVMTRVVTETEYVDDELAEISRNYFAECVETGDVYYFGEHVDIYEDGEIVSNEGEWLAGEGENRAGIIMPGNPLVGSRYYQEWSPDVALDRAEHVAANITFETPAGTFDGCIKVIDTTPLEPGDSSTKIYCPDIGIVFDDGPELIEMVVP